MSDVRWGEAFRSIEFWSFLAVFIPSFVALATLLDAAGVPTWMVLGTGMLFGDAVDRVVSWFGDRYVARVNGVEVSAE